jgi:hypothetical protein
MSCLGVGTSRGGRKKGCRWVNVWKWEKEKRDMLKLFQEGDKGELWNGVNSAIDIL